MRPRAPAPELSPAPARTLPMMHPVAITPAAPPPEPPSPETARRYTGLLLILTLLAVLLVSGAALTLTLRRARGARKQASARRHGRPVPGDPWKEAGRRADDEIGAAAIRDALGEADPNEETRGPDF